MATHSSVLAWRTPGTGKPGGLPSLGHTESDTTEATWRQQHPEKVYCYEEAGLTVQESLG